MRRIPTVAPRAGTPQRGRQLTPPPMVAPARPAQREGPKWTSTSAAEDTCVLLAGASLAPLLKPLRSESIDTMHRFESRPIASLRPSVCRGGAGRTPRIWLAASAYSRGTRLARVVLRAGRARDNGSQRSPRRGTGAAGLALGRLPLAWHLTRGSGRKVGTLLGVRASDEAIATARIACQKQKRPPLGSVYASATVSAELAAIVPFSGHRREPDRRRRQDQGCGQPGSLVVMATELS